MTIQPPQPQDDFNEDSFDQELASGPKDFNVGNTAGTLDKPACRAAITNLANKYAITKNEAFTAAALICLRGGTSSNAQNNLSVHTPSGKNVTLGELKAAVNSASRNASVRRFARGMADSINKVAIAYDQVGNLSKAIRREFPEISKNELYYCSDFNTENPNCPHDIRVILIQDSKNRFKR